MSQKLLIIGWDGATWAYIDPLLAQGALPNLAGLLERGTRAPLTSTVPPYTNIAWPSMATGLSPEKTGIYDAVRAAPGTYTSVPTNLDGFRGVPIWQWANRFGRRAGVLNVPMTYPIRPLEGYLVPGFDTPRRAAEGTHPDSILTTWARQGHPYRILALEQALMDHQNPHQHRQPLETFVSEWEALTREQGEHIAWLWNAHPVDIAFAVFSATDSVNHRTHNAEAIGRVYGAVDAALGSILSTIDDGTLVCLVSDHGSTPADSYIALNRLLVDGGWLSFNPEISDRTWQRLPKPVGGTLEAIWSRLPRVVRRALSWPWLRLDGRLAASPGNVDWARTQVYARTGLGPLYINLAGREPDGCVPQAAYDELCEAVIARVLGARGPDGRKLFRQAWRVQDLYPAASPEDRPPDLILEPNDWRHHMITGYPSDALVRPIPAATEYGTHTPDGIFALAGPSIRSGVQLDAMSIIDVLPTVLAAWGVPIPEETDGEVAGAVFEAEPVVQQLPSGDVSRSSTKEGPEGNEDVLDRLRALGYVE